MFEDLRGFLTHLESQKQLLRVKDEVTVKYEIAAGMRKTSDIDVRAGKLLFYHQDEWHRNSHTAHPSKNINLEITPAFLDTHHLSENHVEQIVQKSVSPYLNIFYVTLEIHSGLTCEKLRFSRH